MTQPPIQTSHLLHRPLKTLTPGVSRKPSVPIQLPIHTSSHTFLRPLKTLTPGVSRKPSGKCHVCVELQGVLVHAGVIDTVEMARRQEDMVSGRGMWGGRHGGGVIDTVEMARRQEDMVRGMGLGGGVRDVTGRG